MATKPKEKELTLTQKLLEIRKEIPYLQKDAEGYNYKYVKGSILLGLLRPKMDELGVMLTYSVTEMETDNVERQVFDKKTKKHRTIQTGRVRMKFVFTFFDAENRDAIIKETMWIQGIGDDIQDIGGYNTYALRYFLLGFFNIPSDSEDPDAFENAINASRPPELLSDEQLDNLKELINGHESIRSRILKAFKKLESIRSEDYEMVLDTVEKLIYDKENNRENT